jgi:flagellar biosynthesis/type III secretory pathway protein FliH
MADDVPARFAKRAEFLNVTADRPRKKPRWMSTGRSSAPPAANPPSNLPPEVRPSLRAAPVPKEFVQAVRRELSPISGPERAREVAANAGLVEQIARSLRPSELPPAETRAVPNAEVVALERGFQGALEELSRVRTRVLEATAGQLATLAAMIARRVIARELVIAPDVLLNLVREALDALSEQSELRVRVGRGFAASVHGLERGLASQVDALRVEVDPTLDDYACLVETELGQVDESIERRLEKLLQALKPDSEAP